MTDRTLAVELRRVLGMPPDATDTQIIAQVEALARYAGPLLKVARPHGRLGELPEQLGTTIGAKLDQHRQLLDATRLNNVDHRAALRELDALAELVGRLVPAAHRGPTLIGDATEAIRRMLNIHAAWLEALDAAGVPRNQDPSLPAALVIAERLGVRP